MTEAEERAVASQRLLVQMEADGLTADLRCYNAALLDAVHPREWLDPEPHDVYDLVVIGEDGNPGARISTQSA